MLLARVIGMATATVRHPSMKGCRLLVVQPVGPDGSSVDGDPIVAVDLLGAGIGEKVIVSSDGQFTRQMIGSDVTPVRWSVIGIRD